MHFTKKTDNILQTVSYLGRYLKRPPVSASRLRHYSKGGMLTFDYLNHRTGRIESLTLPLAALIERLIEHILDKGLKMEERKQPTLPSYAAMLRGYVNVDPYECVLCQSRLVFNGYQAGMPLSELTASTLVLA